MLTVGARFGRIKKSAPRPFDYGFGRVIGKEGAGESDTEKPQR